MIYVACGERARGKFQWHHSAAAAMVGITVVMPIFMGLPRYYYWHAGSVRGCTGQGSRGRKKGSQWRWREAGAPHQ